MYLVSPQLLVTREHIISDNASTSSSPCFGGSGDFADAGGLGSLPASSRGVVLWDSIEDRG